MVKRKLEDKSKVRIHIKNIIDPAENENVMEEDEFV